jgi:hypothetical protein
MYLSCQRKPVLLITVPILWSGQRRYHKDIRGNRYQKLGSLEFGLFLAHGAYR